MSIATRFAPSPTGFLHIGGARTALFNWLYSKVTNGKFLLRIEDTDQVRSTQAAIDAILNSMKWLGLEWDDNVIYQSKNKERHLEVANQLIKNNMAYKCYSTKEEIDLFRSNNPYCKFQSPWRESSNTPLENTPYSIRLKTSQEGTTFIEDSVQGKVDVEHKQLDDMILVRSDNTSTYMLAVVVDDHDMGVNYIIRGDDHLTNTFRQIQIYKAMGWEIPRYAHIPLIHGEDGAKLSKRHGAIGIEEYQKMGYLPEAILSYLLRLGWSSDDDSIIDISQAKEIFNIENIGKSPSRFDFKKLDHINSYFIKNSDSNDLISLLSKNLNLESDNILKDRLMNAMELIKERAVTLIELEQLALLFKEKLAQLDDKSQKILNEGGKELLKKLYTVLEPINEWDVNSITSQLKSYAKENNIKLPMIMQSLRAGVLGTFNSPSITDVIVILGKTETLKRLSQI